MSLWHTPRSKSIVFFSREEEWYHFLFHCMDSGVSYSMESQQSVVEKELEGGNILLSLPPAPAPAPPASSSTSSSSSSSSSSEKIVEPSASKILPLNRNRNIHFKMLPADFPGHVISQMSFIPKERCEMTLEDMEREWKKLMLLKKRISVSMVAANRSSSSKESASPNGNELRLPFASSSPGNQERSNVESFFLSLLLSKKKQRRFRGCMR